MHAPIAESRHNLEFAPQGVEQVLALGRLGWSLPRIEVTTTVRRETAGAYLKAAGIAVRGKGGRLAPSKPAIPPGGSSFLDRLTAESWQSGRPRVG
jgi:hypothetical protein